MTYDFKHAGYSEISDTSNIEFIHNSNTMKIVNSEDKNLSTISDYIRREQK